MIPLSSKRALLQHIERHKLQPAEWNGEPGGDDDLDVFTWQGFPVLKGIARNAGLGCHVAIARRGRVQYVAITEAVYRQLLAEGNAVAVSQEEMRR